MNIQKTKPLNNAKLVNSLFIAILLFTIGCSTSRELPTKQHKSLATLLEDSPIFNQHFTGFALYDPENRRMLYQKNADKYFTPASNTKIYTFYTALKVLGDSMPVIHYKLKGDSLLFWGAGNPLVLHPDFSSAQLATDFLKQQDRKLFFYTGNFQDKHFGPGGPGGIIPILIKQRKRLFPYMGIPCN